MCINKLLKYKRNEDKINSQYINDLMISLHCDQSSYSNQNAWYYIVDDIHLKIIFMYMKTWSMTINDDADKGIDLKICSMALTKTLMPSRKDEKNPLREQTSTMTNISIDSNSSSSAISISYQPPSSLSSHLYYSYKDLYYLFTYNHH